MIEVTKSAATELMTIIANTEHPDRQMLRIYFAGYG